MISAQCATVYYSYFVILQVIYGLRKLSSEAWRWPVRFRPLRFVIGLGLNRFPPLTSLLASVDAITYPAVDWSHNNAWAWKLKKNVCHGPLQCAKFCRVSKVTARDKWRVCLSVSRRTASVPVVSNVNHGVSTLVYWSLELLHRSVSTRGRPRRSSGYTQIFFRTQKMTSVLKSVLLHSIMNLLVETLCSNPDCLHALCSWTLLSAPVSDAKSTCTCTYCTHGLATMTLTAELLQSDDIIYYES